MKDKKKFLAIGASVGFLSLAFSTPTSSLTYQEEIPVSFTFNRGVSISLSASDLHIYDLSPGTADSSNVITVSATTNNVTGYVLTASVGNSTKNTTNLVNGSNNFASIATNASEASLTTDNTWGYSISTDDGSSWSNYSGLPIFSSATWKELANVNTNGTTSIKFKIGAKASSSQASGDYTNVINFTAVTNPRPVDLETAFEDAGKTRYNGYYKMQDMTSAICSAVEVEGAQAQLIDSRDSKVYYVSKLADGNCWMTQNLDHDIVTTQNFYTYANTDVGHGSSSDVNATWTSSEATNNSSFDSSANTNPASYNPGDYCWSGVAEDSVLVSCSQNGNHYHIGNYYKWPAAIAVATFPSNRTAADRSICPAGWSLSKGNGITGSGSFQYLVDQYGWSSSSEALDGQSIYGSPLYFNLSGRARDGASSIIENLGSKGFYYSDYLIQFAQSNIQVSTSEFTYNTIKPAVSSYAFYGIPIRCVAR